MNIFESLPNFLIIGAAKAGSTTLYDLLKQHPQVYLSFVKEPMFFSHDDNYQHGPEWYARTYFPGAGRYPVRGEATPHYLYWSEKVAPRIHQTYGQKHLKFIVIFRDPVMRAYSWYWNMVREGQEDQPFRTALQLEEQRLQEHHAILLQTGAMNYGYLRGSRYAATLQSFLDSFPRQDFLFLLQDDLNQDFASTSRLLLSFLGLDSNIQLQPVTSNPAALPRSHRIQRWLRAPSNFSKRIARLIPFRLRRAIKKSLIQANIHPAKYPPLNPSIEAALRMRLAPEVHLLEEMIGRDLSSWLPK